LSALEVPIQVLQSDVELPAYAYPGDAGMDLRASEEVVLQPFERALIATSLVVAIPEGYAGFVLPRSGLSVKQGVTLINTPGLIDSHYRGELKIAAVNLDPTHACTIKKGDRIAQLVVMGVEQVSFNVCESLDRTERGEGGFGSSGM